MTQTQKATSMLLAALMAGMFGVNLPAEEDERKESFPAGHPTLVRMGEHANEIRGQYNLPPQKLNAELTKAAQDHAWFMAKTGQFSHHSNGGFVSRTMKHNYRGSAYGEIIAMGQTSISGTFQSWLNSPGHRAILLSGAREVGYGYAVSRSGETYWVGVFGN
ncbi:MAG: CAP domain-containing protein [Pirellulaceae bacterium]